MTYDPLNPDLFKALNRCAHEGALHQEEYDALHELIKNSDQYKVQSTVTWHKYPDEMPEDYEYCLVYAKRNGTGEPCPISIAICYKGTWEMLNHSQSNAVSCGDLTDYMDSDEITHWSYLPKMEI